MDIKRFNISPMVSNILLIIVIACSIAVMYTISQIDNIINVKLYDYGLGWDAAWSVPYHNFKWIAYGSLSGTIIVCAAVMALGFLKMKQEKESQNSASKETQPIYQTQTTSSYTQPKTEETHTPILSNLKSKATKEDKKAKQNNTTTTTTSNTNGACPGCKKTFTQSLVMLDFEGGKSKLVNVCPHCNYVLGDADNNQ